MNSSRLASRSGVEAAVVLAYCDELVSVHDALADSPSIPTVLIRQPDLASVSISLDLESGILHIDGYLEAMRFNGPVTHSWRLYALTDVDIGTTAIPVGGIVVPVLLAANRDPAVFPSPNHHLGFGHGIHFCLGAALARSQARAAIGTLVRRFPTWALAVDPSELEWTPDVFLHGVYRLPVLVEGR